MQWNRSAGPFDTSRYIKDADRLVFTAKAADVLQQMRNAKPFAVTGSATMHFEDKDGTYAVQVGRGDTCLHLSGITFDGLIDIMFDFWLKFLIAHLFGDHNPEFQWPTRLPDEDVR